MPTRQPHRDNAEFARFVARVMRAYRARVALGDVDALGSLVALRADLDAQIAAAVAGLRAEPSAYSWAQIGAVLGISRQAAQQRFAEVGGARRVGGQPARLR